MKFHTIIFKNGDVAVKEVNSIYEFIIELSDKSVASHYYFTIDLKNHPGKIYVGRWQDIAHKSLDKVNVVFQMKEHDFFNLLDGKLNHGLAFA